MNAKLFLVCTLLFPAINQPVSGQALKPKEKVARFTNPSGVSSLAKKIDSYLLPYVRMKDFSGTVLIARGDSILFSKAYGKANFELNSPVTPATRFKIGSISKQFTAAAILLLQDRGKLRLDDKLQKFVPDFPKGDKITLSMLLDHTSGISRDLKNDGGVLQLPHTPEELVNLIQKAPLSFEPGSKSGYSNNGYRILAYVVEKISGNSLDDFLKQNFFVPLGIRDIGQDSELDLVPNRADGYVRWINNSIGNAPFHDVSNDIGSGGLYSTAESLYKWDRSLHGAKILSRPTVRLMTSKDYGIGEATIANHKSIGHDGRLTGFTSFNDYYPDDDTYIVFLSNIESGAAADIRKALPAIAFGEAYSPPQNRADPISVDPTVLDLYVGQYEVFPGFVLTAKKMRNSLVLGSGDGGFFPMFAESETKFFYPLRYAEIEFVKTPNGIVTEMKWKEFGSEFICKKIK